VRGAGKLSEKDRTWAENVADKFGRGEYRCAQCGEPLPHAAPCAKPKRRVPRKKLETCPVCGRLVWNVRSQRGVCSRAVQERFGGSVVSQCYRLGYERVVAALQKRKRKRRRV
jgi:hypothetical protein